MAQTPNDTVVYKPTIEGLFVRGMKGLLPSDTLRELQSVGLDLSRPLRDTYPATMVAQAIEIAGKALAPTGDLEQRWYAVGKRVVPGVRETALGTAVLAFAKLVGPQSALQRMPSIVKSTSNYLEAVVKPVGARCHDLEITGSLGPASYLQAVVEDILLIAGAANLSVRATSVDAQHHRVVYRVTWG